MKPAKEWLRRNPSNRGQKFVEEIQKDASADLDQAIALLRGIVEGCVHPETAQRRVMVDLKEIRSFLDKFTPPPLPPASTLHTKG